MWEFILGAAAIVSAIFAVLSYLKPTIQLTEKTEEYTEKSKPEESNETPETESHKKPTSSSVGDAVGMVLLFSFFLVLALGLWAIVLTVWAGALGILRYLLT